MTSHRLRQGNLMGPAGFLVLEDNEAMKFVRTACGGLANHLVARPQTRPAPTRSEAAMYDTGAPKWDYSVPAMTLKRRRAPTAPEIDGFNAA
jgi:hypothetical protein